MGNEFKGVIVDSESGEIIGHGGATVYEWEEVDAERFVKLYLGGLKKATGLSKAGLAVFEIVYHRLQDRPGQDTIMLSLLTSGMKKSAYYKGLKDLLDKEFLFRSPYDGTFFVNIRFLFNGDRLAFIEGYIKRPDPLASMKVINDSELPALPAPTQTNDGKS